MSALRSLRILDTEQEQEYDTVTDLAATICQTPMALISLVDQDRQWFKARRGLDASETPRDIAFCAHAILQKDLLEVPDARLDRRFATNPLVTGEPHLRFYAAAPLITSDGFVVGTLCVADRKPRTLTPEQRSALRTLASQVMHNMELRRETARHREMFDAMPLPSWIIDVETMHLAEANEAAVLKYGRRREDIIGMPAHDVFGLDPASPLMVRVKAGEPIRSETCRQTTASGEQLFVELTSQALLYAGRDSRLLVAVDVTERTRTTEELARRDEQLRQLVDGSQDIIFETDAQGRFAFVNAAMERVFGYGPQEIIGRPFTYLVSPASRASVERHYRAQLESQTPSTYLEFPALARDGREVWIGQNVQAVVGPTGVRAFRAVARDITDLHGERQARTDIEKRFEAFMNNSPAISSIKDADGRFVWVSEPLARLFGTTAEALTGTADVHLSRSAVEPSIGGADASVITSGIPVRVVETLTTPNGAQHHLLIYKFPVPGPNGTVLLGEVGVDVTDRVALELELADARDAALASARQKSEFLANMSHEIRTPMNGVLGMLGLLQGTALTEDQLELADTARFSAESLMTIINDVLDFSKIEAGKLTFENLDFEVRSAVEGVIDLLGDAARKKSLEIGCIIETDVPKSVRGDAGRIRQILLNLVGNAIKFTESGGVVIHVSLGEPNDTGNTSTMLKFSVVDTGIGISSEVQKHLFAPFVQADASTTRRFGGTGLGLAICRNLAVLMRGDIGVESGPASGSNFWFTACLEAATQASQLPAPEMRIGPVLIIDDSATARRLLSLQLASRGVASEVASDAAEALRKLRTAADEGVTFSAVISDLNMSRMDGVTLARMVRAQPAYGSPKFIVISGTAPTESREALLAKGVDLWLQKPVKQEQLFGAVCPDLARKPEAPAAIAPAMPPPKRLGRILVVEDNVVNQKVVMRQLQKLGYPAEVVVNGIEALKALRSQEFALVLMDCHMPEMDGFQATAELRRLEMGLRHIPVIALTASALPEDSDKCRAAGMDDFLTKPIREADLLAAMERWMPETVVPAKPIVPTAQTTDSFPVVDLEALRSLQELAEGDQTFVIEVVEAYVEQAKGLMTDAAAAALAGDRQAVIGHIHTLSGSSSNVGASALAGACREAEGRLRTVPESQPSMLPELQQLLDQSIAGLREQMDCLTDQVH